jgi:hypothetical protein
MRNEARQEARQNPKWAIEGDVVIAVVGLVIAFIGGWWLLRVRLGGGS